MPDDWQWWLWVGVGVMGGCFVLLYGLIAAFGAYAINSMHRSRFRSMPDWDFLYIRVKANQHVGTEWLAEQGFELAECLELVSPIARVAVVGYRHVGSAVFFCVYLFPEGTSSDITTILSDGNLITTASKSDAMMIPTPPGCWSQAFTDKTPEQRLLLHLEAEAAVKRTTGAIPAAQCRSLAEELQDGIARQLGYLSTIRLWQLRIPFWYFIRRRRLVNKSIAEKIRH